MADTKPSLFLEGNPPLLIDEWQMAPVIWDAVRFAVDKRGLMGQSIITVFGEKCIHSCNSEDYYGRHAGK